jgi:hypothetical protein
MSALGHKQTFAAQKGMSALPPKADMCGANKNVRYWAKADILNASLMGYPCGARRSRNLLDFLVRVVEEIEF